MDGKQTIGQQETSQVNESAEDKTVLADESMEAESVSEDKNGNESEECYENENESEECEDSEELEISMSTDDECRSV